MDPYFRPILLSTALVVLLNTVFILPFRWAPILSYFIGGLLAVMLFKKELKDEFQEGKAFDASVLAGGTGLVVGAILTLIVSIKLNDPDTQRYLIDAINDAMKMHSTAEFAFINHLGPGFYLVTAIFTIAMTSFVSLFGGLVVLPFINKAKR